MFNNMFFRKSCHNVKKYYTPRKATDDNILRRMRFSCWITKDTDTHSARQQWLRERVSTLRYTYIAWFVFS
jgi:hypothetical protein